MNEAAPAHDYEEVEHGGRTYYIEVVQHEAGYWVWRVKEWDGHWPVQMFLTVLTGMNATEQHARADARQFAASFGKRWARP